MELPELQVDRMVLLTGLAGLLAELCANGSRRMDFVSKFQELFENQMQTEEMEEIENNPKASRKRTCFDLYFKRNS